MLSHQDCPQTPGGRVRVLGFARIGARGCGRSPHNQGCPQTLGGRIRALGFARIGARGCGRSPHNQGCPQTPGGRVRASLKSHRRALILTHRRSSGRDGGPASSWTRSQGRGCARPASEGSLDKSPSRRDGLIHRTVNSIAVFSRTFCAVHGFVCLA